MERLSVSLIGGVFSLAILMMLFVLGLTMKAVAQFIYFYVFWIISWPSCSLTQILTGGGDNTSYAVVYLILFINHFVVGCAVGFLFSVISRRITKSKMQ